MTKTKTRRIALILVVAVVVSLCAVSGIFAKYVTSADGSDEARVAKWGVQLAITGDNFSNQYATHDSLSYDGPYSVKTTTDMLVAPGTSSDDVDGNVYFEITGSPEVATKIDIALTDVQDVFLKGTANPKYSTYTDYTKVTGYDESGKPTYGTFHPSKNGYWPVVWTLKQIEVAGQPVDVKLASGKLADIQKYLDEYSADISKSSYSPDQNIGAKFELSWKWDFEGNDKAETFLGNVAAGIASVSSEKANTNVAYTLEITATQVD